MPLPALPRGPKPGFLRALIVGLALLCSSQIAGAEQRLLQLEVFINGYPAKLIGSFVQMSDGRIAATRSELDEIGLKVDLRLPGAQIIALKDLPKVDYRYDEPRQRIEIAADHTALKPRTFDLSAPPERPAAIRADWGALLNYNLLGTSGSLLRGEALTGSGASTFLEGRVFSPYGTFEQSGIIRYVNGIGTEFLRLETSYRYSDRERMISYRAGDGISSALPWTRPVRFAGAQAQSNFALRPDLVTIPLPSLGGTAAVPSTVDVYVNNIRTFSQEVGAGPFTVSNVPLLTSSGDAQLVIRDASGQERRTTIPFFASSRLLAPGISSWSIEGGLPRLGYGSGNDGYVAMPMGSATLRRGIFDWLTLEGHIEGTRDLLNGGIGAVLRTGSFGIASGAIAASRSREGSGLQTYLSYETRFLGMNLQATSQRTFGAYDDLASITAHLRVASSLTPQISPGIINIIQPVTVFGGGQTFYTEARPPRAVERISVSAPLPLDPRSSITLSFMRLEDNRSKISNIASMTYSRSFAMGMSLFASAFYDFNNDRSRGIFAGFSMPIGASTYISANTSRNASGLNGGVDIIRPMGTEPGSYGWRVRASEGGSAFREAAGSYRGTYGMAQVAARQSSEGVTATAELRGSIATIGGGVFLSQWIEDGFAVVNAGAPGLQVFHDHRLIGTTDGRGMLLVPGLRSHQNNRIHVDPTNLPVDATMVGTQETVAPAERAGIMVQFRRVDDTRSALVSFRRRDGSFVAAGSLARLGGQSEFTVGHDGQVFLQGLGNTNTVSIELIDGQCTATFPFRSAPGQQVRINDVPCL